MDINQPQLRLFVDRSFDEPDAYTLHAVTLCKRTSFRADGHLPLPAALEENGVWKITLKIKQDETLPDFVADTPVVHSLKLGPLPEEAEEAQIKVELQVEQLVQQRGVAEEEKPKAEIHTTSAQEDSRPGM